ncbi:RNA helicase [Podochytrium sp. JEL0797]|nr:RNA helicase [Podochytrium sp. JEL0797]
MFSSLALRAIGRTRAPSNWTFNTRFPRAEVRAPKTGGKKALAFPKTAPRFAHKTFAGLALPPSRRLARLPTGEIKKAHSLPRNSPPRNTPPPQKKQRSVRPAVIATSAAHAAKIAEMEAKQRAHDKKFRMQDLHTESARMELLQEKIKNASFDTMGLSIPALQAIKALLGETAKPTPVQALAIPASLTLSDPSQKNPHTALLVGAETGSGKTLAYLLPMIHRLKLQEQLSAQQQLENPNDVIDAVLASSDPLLSDSALSQQLVSSSKLRKLRRPRAIILVPSRDLVHQVTTVTKSLCAHHPSARLTVLGVHSRLAHPERVVAKLASTPIDILVSTPHELRKMVSENAVGLSKVSEVVIDESDTLFDESNTPDLEYIQNAIRTHQPVAAAAVNDASTAAVEDVESVAATADATVTTTPEPLTTYISATFPVSMTSKIAAFHPQGFTQIATPKLHRASSTLKQIFLHVSASTTKPNLLLDVLKRAAQSGETRVIVFVNSRDTGTWVADFLRGKGVVRDGEGGVFLVSGQMEGKVRDAVFSLFKKGKGDGISKGVEGLLDAAAGTNGDGSASGEYVAWKDRMAVIVATDVASRGVDTTAADHVVLYDFPRSSIEYLHRVGRTARNGGKGRATSLLTNRDRRVAEEIEKSVRRGNVLG